MTGGVLRGTSDVHSKLKAHDADVTGVPVVFGDVEVSVELYISVSFDGDVGADTLASFERLVDAWAQRGLDGEFGADGGFHDATATVVLDGRAARFTIDGGRADAGSALSALAAALGEWNTSSRCQAVEILIGRDEAARRFWDGEGHSSWDWEVIRASDETDRPPPGRYNWANTTLSGSATFGGLSPDFNPPRSWAKVWKPKVVEATLRSTHGYARSGRFAAMVLRGGIVELSFEDIPRSVLEGMLEDAIAVGASNARVNSPQLRSAFLGGEEGLARRAVSIEDLRSRPAAAGYGWVTFLPASSLDQALAIQDELELSSVTITARRSSCRIGTASHPISPSVDEEDELLAFFTAMAGTADA